MKGIICMSFGLILLSVNPVLSSIFCKDSTIDSIAFANDLRMYFIASGGHYWWIKEDRFPPKDSDAKKLPAPLTKTTAATYIDGDTGCGANPQADAEAAVGATPSKAGATGSKVGSKIDGAAPGSSKARSKVEGGGLTPAKSSAMSTMGSTMSTRSGIAQSSIPKSSTGGGVKSTVSKTASKK